jgi:hypothetical protein
VNAFARDLLGALAVFAVASPGLADNYIEIFVARVDDYLNPADEFITDLRVALDDGSGVTDVTLATAQQSFPLEFRDDSWETEDGFDSLALLRTAFDGTWTVTISGGAAASTSTFVLDAASWVDADFFPTASMLNPTNGATGVSPTVTFEWTDPTVPATPDALEVSVTPENDSNGQFDDSLSGTLSVTDTSWQPPLPLDAGPNEFDVIYLRVDASPITTPLEVQSGSIAWGDVPLPPGYPTATPLLALGSDVIIGFSVPEPSGAPLAAAGIAALGVVALARHRIT